MPQPAGDPRAQHKCPPTRLVLWHLQPCWVIILLSLAAPLVLRAEQYQELLISQPTSAGWQY
ncbi:MAG: hypothetical protein RKL24_02785, partial [Defluviicoccus sp.]|nr:hypothetical protein [Defluviicoccus sp.]